jgi:hypothetical protein
VVTHDPESLEVEVYDARSGSRLSTGLEDGDQVLAVAPGTRHTMAYVVRPARTTPGGHLELRTCDLDLGQCEVDALLLDGRGLPVLAR